MTDLSEKLDQNRRQRLLEAIQILSPAEFRDTMISLMGDIGVRVQSAREEQGALIIQGQGEESYLMLASRAEFSDPELVVRGLLEEARTSGRTPVFMTLQSLDPGTLNYLEKEKVSFADLDKFLALLQKYGVDEPLLAKKDLKVLEDRGEPCLPSVCRLEALLEEAEERRGKGDLARAVQVLDQALEIKSLNDSLWLKKASYLLEMGRPAEALTAANRAAELRSGDAATWFLIALIQNQLGDREREMAAYDNVLRIDPGHAPALLNKGATLYELGRLEWALRVFNDLVHRYPQEPRGWNNRGLVLKSLGRPIEAQASFEKSSVLDRDFADPLINIARLLEEKGDTRAAVEGWKNVLRLVDSRADIWAHLGSCMRSLGEDEDALTAFDRALYLEPSLELVRQERDALAARMGRAQPAEESAVGRTPTEAPEGGGAAAAEPQRDVTDAPVQDAGTIYVPPSLPSKVSEERSLKERGGPGALQLVEGPTEGKKAEAATIPAVPGTGSFPERTAQGATPAGEADAGPIEIKAKPVWPYEVSLPPLPEEREERSLSEASLLLAGGEREKALQVTELALKEGSDLELMRLKARELLSLGRGEEAAEMLKEALRHSPDDARTILDLEALFHRFGGEGSRLLRPVECQEALGRRALGLLEGQEYEELSRMDAGNEGPPARQARALALMRLGRYRDASKLLKSLISEFPASSEGLNNLGVCMRFMGEYDYDQAIHLMKLALEVDPHYSDAMNNIGCTLFVAGRYDQALERLRAAADQDRRPEYLLNLSNAQMALGDAQSAKESLTSALKMEEGADVLYMLGVIAEGEKQYRWALSLYQDALEKSPGFREAQAGRDRTKVLAKK